MLRNKIVRIYQFWYGILPAWAWTTRQMISKSKRLRSFKNGNVKKVGMEISKQHLFFKRSYWNAKLGAYILSADLRIYLHKTDAIADYSINNSLPYEFNKAWLKPQGKAGFPFHPPFSTHFKDLAKQIGHECLSCIIRPESINAESGTSLFSAQT